ncbi:nucleotidyltransferase [Paenibacillus provencensis]|uniref:tRNA(Met) cytidine acetate ligase n=1 Tax=Paenibacillus provencensis TaxID=441151 RepID=A0ABW3Q647_9BACL|nr:nucleotidyltransferase [Paenibacillus sp. MER 78]MCM3130327.1 nucleotidyltransferase [Paenibacillus sp. MER 78]
MSRTVGLIVEYNPMHNGHVYHLEASKKITEADTSVAVMSGHFLQRGEPAMLSKWARAEMALAMGVDLVLELPVSYAVGPAEWFAHGAVATLHHTGIVDSLCFGSESGELAPLAALADLLASEPKALSAGIQQQLQQGASYPAAYAAAAAGLAPGGDVAGALALLKQPNNTLGLHYMIALKRLGSAILPFTAQRTGAGYHDMLPGPGSIASATAIRRLLLGDGPEAAAPYVPAATLAILQREWQEGRAPVHLECFRDILLAQLVTTSAAELAQYAEVTEGLEHRILNQLPKLTELSVDSLLEALKTKRYTRTKLQRMLIHILLHHNKEELMPSVLAEGPHYIRVLGFNNRGQALLKEMKKKATLPVIIKPSSFSHPQLTRDIQASALYALGMGAAADTQFMYRDYYQSPVRI